MINSHVTVLSFSIRLHYMWGPAVFVYCIAVCTSVSPWRFSTCIKVIKMYSDGLFWCDPPFSFQSNSMRWSFKRCSSSDLHTASQIGEDPNSLLPNHCPSHNSTLRSNSLRSCRDPMQLNGICWGRTELSFRPIAQLSAFFNLSRAVIFYF